MSPPAIGASYDLEWPDPSALPGWRECGNTKEEIVDPSRQVPGVWCAVRNARDTEALDRVATFVAAIRATLDRWLETNFELRRLNAVVAELRDQELPICEDSRRLAGEAGVPPTDDTARVAVDVRIRQQTNVVAAFTACEAIWHNLDGKDWSEHPELDPRRIYEGAPREAARSESDTARLLRDLALARDKLRALEAAEEVLFEDGSKSLSLPLLPPSSTSLSTLAAALSRLESRRPLEQRSAEDLRGESRRWNAVAQAVAALVTTVAYVLSVYGGHTYGQRIQYLSALALGLLGQLAGFSVNSGWFRREAGATRA